MGFRLGLYMNRGGCLQGSARTAPHHNRFEVTPGYHYLRSIDVVGYSQVIQISQAHDWYLFVIPCLVGGLLLNYDLEGFFLLNNADSM